MEIKMTGSFVRFGVLAASLLTLAACGHEAPPPVVAAPAPAAMAEPAPPPPAPVSADQQFLDQAASGGMAEVEAGKLAEKQAKARAVRSFGARMVRDHGAANARLMALAKKLNMTPNTTPADLSQITGLNGADFDKAYISGQVQAHQDVIAAFEAEASNGQNAQLKRFAHGALPMLRSHLRQAEAIAKRVGG
jgi:putative membrane protein